MRKYAPYILILLVLVGLFSPMGEVRAQTPAPVTSSPDQLGTCTVADINTPNDRPVIHSPVTRSACTGFADATHTVTWKSDAPGSTTENLTRTTDDRSDFDKNIASCNALTGGLDACLVKLTYYIFYVIPSFLLNLVANIFNTVIALTLGSNMYTASFISEAWTAVRDLSNVFFILILLYIAIRTILGLSGSDVKKMVVQVIIMALLINFSMFFSKVIIDSSNILALVFYNKINVETVNADGTVNQRIFVPVLKSGPGEIQDKDISGGLVSKFDPTKLLSADFFTKVKERNAVVFTPLGFAASVGSGALLGNLIPIPGLGAGVGAIIGGITYGLSFYGSQNVPPGIMIGIILSAGLIMLFAAYAFFISGLAFISRLVELWVLIIFSPFAFMSSTIPLFSKIEGIGWDEWIKRILRLSFMAPIFMFFLYLIFKLVNAHIWEDIAVRTPAQQGMVETMIFLILPALTILILLHKATGYAKKASGELGSMLIKGTEIALGLAAGATLGIGARGLQASAGRLGSMAANSEWLSRRETEGKFGGALMGRAARYLGGAEFDVRKGAVGAVLGTIEGATGIKASRILSKEGGYEGDRKRAEEKRRKRNEELKVHEDEKLKQDLNRSEEDLQVMLNKVAKDFEFIDEELKSARQKKLDSKGVAGDKDFDDAVARIKELNDAKGMLRTGTDTSVTYKDSAGVTQKRSMESSKVVNGPNAGKTIKEMQGEIIPEQKNAIETENRSRAVAYAQTIREGSELNRKTRNIFRKIPFNSEAGDNAASRNAAAHKIIMDAKIEDRGGKH